MDTHDTIRDEWFPAAVADAVSASSAHPFQLLDERYVLLSDVDRRVTVAVDTCPHRGAQLSLGSYDGTHLRCGYHGWEFDIAGRCVHQPAHLDRTPPAASGLTTVHVRERYGLWWVCVGDEPRELPEFADYDTDSVVRIVLDPAMVESSGPRIVENFLDIAHFPFVHAGYLGEVPHTAVERYGVDLVDGALRLTDVAVWQPDPGPRATQGGHVAYNYSVTHPYAATLSKIPAEHDGGEIGGFSILLVASPVTETSCRVFRVVAARDPDVDHDVQRAFNRTIFLQDVPTVESQRPKRLPLDPRAEVHQPADAGSLAYRKWLVERGIAYGTIPTPSPDRES